MRGVWRAFRTRRVMKLGSLLLVALVTAAMPYVHPSWHVKTHVFAANIALHDATDDGKVTIPPFGDFTVSPNVVEALRRFPGDYRAGVVGPDVFPDIYVGQSFAHVDHWCDANRWIADHWMRQVYDAAQAASLGASPGPLSDLQLRRIAFAYGYLTHGAQDMFGHTFINYYVGAKWGSFTTRESLYVDARHVALEAYVAKHTPPPLVAADDSISVDDRFQAENLIKAAPIRTHAAALHYRRFLAMHDWLGTAIDQTFARMNHDTSYVNCYVNNPSECFWLNYMIGWRKDIDRGLRHLVDASGELGSALVHEKTREGIEAESDWISIWVPKMFGAHAVGEVDAQMIAFGDWWAKVNPLARIDSIISHQIWIEADKFLREHLGPDYEFFKLVAGNPAYAVDSLFPAESLAMAKADMHIRTGRNAIGALRTVDSLVAWQDFEALYNTVVASKLVLLNGAALDELARRAGISTPLFGPTATGANVMIGVMRSMDGDHQWDSTTIRADGKKFSYGLPFSRPMTYSKGTVLPGAGHAGPPVVQTGTIGSACPNHYSVAPEAGDTATGYALSQAPEAREKLFQRIFKGWGGPGPGSTPEAGSTPPAPARLAPLGGSNSIDEAIDSLRLTAQQLATRIDRVDNFGPAQLSRFSQNPRGLRFTWGRAVAGPAVQQVRSAAADLESALRRAARTSPPSSGQGQRAAFMRTQLAKLDQQLEDVVDAPDRAAAQRAASVVRASVDALALTR